MFRLASSILILLAALPAAAGHQTLICAECRAVQDHPRDYGNHAFNELIEPMDDNFSLFTTYSTSTYVYNLDGQWALVLLEDVIEDTGVSVTFGGIHVPVQISSEYVKISVQSQFGDLTVYELMETSKPMVVGDGTPPPPPSHPAPEQQLEDYRAQVPQTSSGAGSVGTPCCQTGEFYWYYDMPEFQIRTFNE